MATRKIRKRIKKAGVGFAPYDMRLSFANWCEAARIPRTRRRLYMGHSSGDITDMYEQHEIAEFIAGDAKLLKECYDAQMCA